VYSIGEVAHRDVPGLLRAAHVLVVPSLVETQGIAVVEGLACELPVVASGLAAIRKVTEDGRLARLFRAGDSRSVEEALCEVLAGCEDEVPVSSDAIAVVRDRFDEQQCVARVEEVYRVARTRAGYAADWR
jgi:glycosyltransferase involved in cell wall biosynthesis